MTKDRIRNHFANKGYKVVEDLCGKVIIKKNGFPVGNKSFDSLNQAHKHFFNY